MVFSSLVFLFLFLPAVLFFYYIADRKFKNIILLIFSLGFYTWGEPSYVIFMLVSILFDYLFGILISASKTQNKKKVVIFLCVLFNVSFLGYFKYTNFFIQNLNQFWGINFPLRNIMLPLGISFFTFHGMSYVIDIYRGHAKVQKNLFNLALYITFFPQLVAGPIVRYQTIADEISERKETIDDFVSGLERFCIGTFKKVLIANNVGFIADQIINQNFGNISIVTSWIGILCYTAQIYFDFSGYSDMAIGLARMFGFHFLENFNYPYISKSITEFWRRWHISLSTWFRDYVYISLGGNRVGTVRMYFNLFIVWFLTGFWHGASWNFIAWGLYFFVILVLEKAFLEKFLSKLYVPLQHLYAMFLVIISWVFFRIENFKSALSYLKIMFGGAQNFYTLYDKMLLNENKFLFLAAIIFATPIYPYLRDKIKLLIKNESLRLGLSFPAFFALFLVALSYLIKSSFNPFIYFRF